MPSQIHGQKGEFNKNKKRNWGKRIKGKLTSFSWWNDLFTSLPQTKHWLLKLPKLINSTYSSKILTLIALNVYQSSLCWRAMKGLSQIKFTTLGLKGTICRKCKKMNSTLNIAKFSKNPQQSKRKTTQFYLNRSELHLNGPTEMNKTTEMRNPKFD